MVSTSNIFVYKYMNKKVEISLFLVSLFAVSCDQKSKIAIIKNNTSELVIGGLWRDDRMSDSDLYDNNVYFEYSIAPGESNAITIPGSNLNTAPDSTKKYLYIFNNDIVNKYQKLKQCKGVLKSSLLKIIKIQINTVKAPIDTVYINQ